MTAALIFSIAGLLCPAGYEEPRIGIHSARVRRSARGSSPEPPALGARTRDLRGRGRRGLPHRAPPHLEHGTRDARAVQPRGPGQALGGLHERPRSRFEHLLGRRPWALRPHAPGAVLIFPGARPALSPMLRSLS